SNAGGTNSDTPSTPTTSPMPKHYRNRPRHPWQLSTRRPTVHPNGTHHENQRTTHHHRRRCRSSTINPGHRHLTHPSAAAKSRQMKLRVTPIPSGSHTSVDIRSVLI